MKINKAVKLMTAALLVSQASYAATLSFTGLNDDASGLVVDGLATGVTAVRSAVGDDLNYAVTYSGVVDGVSAVVTFDVLVEGFSGGTVTSDSVTVGGTSTQVEFGDPSDENEFTWTVGGASGVAGADNRFGDGETLSFTITNLTSSVGVATFTEFDAFTLDEWGGNSHEAVIGSGTGLSNATTNGGLNVTVDEAGPLFISSSTIVAGNGSGASNWGVTNVGFNIDVDTTVVPEPSSTLLLGLAGVGFLMRRKRA